MKFILATIFIFSATAFASDLAGKVSTGDPSFTKDEINRLKDEVVNKKTQMMIFNQLIQKEGLESSYPVLTVEYQNEMSSRYKVDSIVVSLDQERVFNYRIEDNKNPAGIGKELQMYKSPVVPGTHEVFVEVVYRGNDSGLFSYVNDYKISTSGKQTFELKKGASTKIEVVGFEKGWVLTDFKDRPDLRIKIVGSNSGNPVK